LSDGIGGGCRVDGITVVGSGTVCEDK